MRRCYRCQKEKELTDFYKSKSKKLGRAYCCKECDKAEKRETWEKEPEKLKARMKWFYTKNQADRIKKVIAYRKKDGRAQVRYKATVAANSLIRSGTIPKLPCETCKTTQKLQAHHDDYTKPLSVRWLCIKHHREWHMKNKAIYPPT